MVDKMVLFHGGRSAVKQPEIETGGYYKDFGYGFYCTSLETQAKRWALTKRPRHVVNAYSYTPGEDLKLCVFETMTEEWLDFITSCRRGEPHMYDIVEGPMADDTIWTYVEDFIEETISREAFWALVKFRYPTHQIAFCTGKALQTLSFERSYEV